MNARRLAAWAEGMRGRGQALTGRVARRAGPPVALCAVLLSGLLGQLAAAGLGIAPTAYAAGMGSRPGAAQGTPNRVNPGLGTTSVIHPWQAPKVTNLGQPVAPTPQIGRGLDPATGSVALPMKPASMALSATVGAQLVGSDGALTVTVPAGAISAADLAAAGGKLTLLVSQVAPASGASAGGSGHISLGMYLLQLVDANGRRVTHGLRKAITLTLHYGPKGMGGDPSAGAFAFNLPLPHGAALAPAPAVGASAGTTGSGTTATATATATTTTTATGTPTATATATGKGTGTPGTTGAAAAASGTGAPAGAPAGDGLGAGSQQKPRVDLGAHTLSATVQPLTAQTSVSYNTDAPVASFGGPDPFNVDLNAGGLTATYPLDLPSGPGGLTPPLQLTYSSASVSEQHNPQAAAPWVGEGWNLSLGSISWAEHQVSTGIWESEWKLNDAYGTSADLIPPDLKVSTYWDDTVNYPCDTGTTGKQPTYPCAMGFQTSPETHAKVVLYSNANAAASSWLPDGAGAQPPCWRVFLPNGIMEEFGCTQDSLQWYFVPGIGDEIAGWYPDLISDPAGNQIHIGYNNEVESKSFNGTNHSYVRDVVLANVEYDSPTCLQNATVYPDNYCTGSAAPSQWAPLMRVHFNALHSAQNVYGLSCTANGSLRCDDPVDVSGGMSAPLVQSAWVLNSVQVQVSQAGNWQTLRSYNLSYDQTPQWTAVDPVSGQGESVAGHLDLTRIQEVGSDGSTALPPVTLHYTYFREHYEDSSAISPAPNGNAGCGPSWNKLHCNLWSETEGGNGYYPDTMDNGLGLEEKYTWAEARNNTHGGYSGASNNPLSCDGHESAGDPCDEADDQAWSRIVLASRSSTVLQAWASGNKPVTSTTTYHYLLTTFPTNTQLCADCTASMEWGSQNDVDYLDYYNGRFMGFAETDVNQPDGSVQRYHYYTTTGWGVYDKNQIGCGTSPPRMPNGVPCNASPWWNLGVAGHGRAYEVDYNDTNGITLISKQTTGYSLTCPPLGVAATPTHSWDGINTGSLDNMNVAIVDLNNPVATCEIHTTQTDNYLYDDQSSSAHSTTTAGYDGNSSSNYGRLVWTIANSNGGGGVLGSPTQIVTHYAYVWNDAVTGYPHSATGTYIVDRLAETFVQDSSAQPAHDRCLYVTYDGQSSVATGQQSSLTKGEATGQTTYTSCGTYANNYATSGPIATTTAYDSYGQAVAGDDADAVAGDTTHTGCTTPSQVGTLFTSCTTLDATYGTLPIASGNAKAQTTSVSYGNPTAPDLGGFGLWPTSATDPNGAVTSTSYDGYGRTTSVTLPGETSGETTSSATYTTWCAQGSNGGVVGNGQAPCVEVDTTQRLDGSAGDTVMSRSFYDGAGRLVETRSPAPGAGESGGPSSGHDVVRFVSYDVMGRPVQQSVSFQVAAYTGPAGAAAFATWPTSGVSASSSTYDGLGRVTKTTDPQGNTTTSIYNIMCGFVSGDSACYDQTTTVDARSHYHKVERDALGRTAYDASYTGNGTSGSPYTQYAVTRLTYDYGGDLTKVLEPDGTHALTYTYDTAGRETAMSDPDRGSETSAYDANGNLTQSVDARGSAGTVYLGYDGLNRPLWRNTTNSPTGAYVSYSYDTGTNGIGRLSSEQFNTGKALGVGSYAYSYDARGQTTGLTAVVDGSSAPFSFGYNDVGQPTSVGYADGTYVCDSYDSTSGALSTVSVTAPNASAGCQTSGQTTLASGLAYGGDAGAAGLVTGAALNAGNGSTYNYAASYDDDQRLLSSSLSLASSGALLYQVQPGYDATSNVTSVTTTLGTGTTTSTDQQSFCYDEQNRLIWASSATANGPNSPGTSTPCASNTAGSLTGQGVLYTASYGYDTLDRLTSGPADGGSAYTYGDAAHLHAATSTSGGYTAAYDAAGNMTCRPPTSSTSCTGTQTGAQLAYDNEGRLSTWRNQPTNPSSSTSELYDGAGHRVAQCVTNGAATTTITYVGNVEELSTTAGVTTTTTSYSAGGTRIAQAVNGAFSYLGSDGLGSAEVALDGSGNPQASVLYDSCGNVRYSSGTMLGSYGYTGQRHATSTSASASTNRGLQDELRRHTAQQR